MTTSSAREVRSGLLPFREIRIFSAAAALTRHAILFVLLVSSAFLAIRIIALQPTHLTAIWLPSGIALAALLGSPGLSAIPTIWLANWAIIAAENHDAFLSWRPYSFLICAVNTVGPLLGWWIWKRWLKLTPFTDGWHYLKFVLGVALLPALLTSWLIVAIIRISGHLPDSTPQQLAVQAMISTVSDALGVFLVVPLVLSPEDSGFIRSRGRRLLAYGASVGVSLVVCYVAFPWAPYVLWISIPLALISAIACGPRGVVVTVGTFAVYGLVATGRGIGPFFLHESSPYIPLFRMGMFAFSFGITGQFAGIVLDQLRRHQHHLEELVSERTAALAKAKEGAEAADRAKSQFLATMSHEIRTPMNGVLGFARMLEAGELDAQQREYVESILTSGSMLLTLLNDILDLSKIEAGGMQIERNPVDLRRAANDVTRLFASAADRKHLRLSCTIEDSVPPLVYGDETRITQVLANLVSNAVKFTSQGGVDLRVSSGPQEPSGDGGRLHTDVAFHIRDTGIGITDEQMARLFRSFSQADSSITRRFGGSGLGLVISRRLCELMAGRLDAESRKGEGSTFTARIRFELAPKPEAGPSNRGGRAVVVEGAEGSLEILLVEDNPLNRRLGLAMLQRLGHRVTFAENGREAVERISSRRFDLALMDVQMPEMDGLTATRLIREGEAQDGGGRLPIIAVTADAMADDRDRCLKAGMDDYLMKPLDLDQLREKIVGVVRKSKTVAPKAE